MAKARAPKRRARADEEPTPKTTRPEAIQRREPEPAVPAEAVIRRTLDAQPDRVDIRDWFYQPRLAPLPDRLINCDLVPAILDQGSEGACTGFALAATINYLLQRRELDRRVSPRMLYEMARRYDQWPGESYEGSSARGAMKGWVRHGVCAAATWPHDLAGPQHFTQEIEDESRGTPGGAFYRVMHRRIRDMHAALNEVGILYVTLMVHEGWHRPAAAKEPTGYVLAGNYLERTFPVIQRRGRASSGHAVAIVGYTHQGFIIQNSWGEGWGDRGFALLPYEDYMLHATDVWVAQLGVPVTMDLWVGEHAADTVAGLHRATRAIPLNEIRPYVVDIGNDGDLSLSGNYWTTEEDLQRLFTESIPKAAQGWSRRRVLLYLHGGLNDEQTVARRIIAFRDVLQANEIYPLHIMWETGAMETIGQIIGDWVETDRRASGVADWLRAVREGAIEAKDRTLELTAAAPGTALWNKMKENARSASRPPDPKRSDPGGGMQLILKHVRKALEPLAAADRRSWEVHVVGHSAGSIIAAHALPLIAATGITFKTLQFMAPAVTVADFKRLVVPSIRGRECPLPTLYVLDRAGELDDDVGPYGKSLLYLVSNAFEGRRETPLLGMMRFISREGLHPDEEDRVDREMEQLFQRKVDGLPGLVIAGEDRGAGCWSQSETHGGFDNDTATLNSILYRILGREPVRPFELRDLQF